MPEVPDKQGDQLHISDWRRTPQETLFRGYGNYFEVTVFHFLVRGPNYQQCTMDKS